MESYKKTNKKIPYQSSVILAWHAVLNDIPTLQEWPERGGPEVRNHDAPQNARDVRFEDPQGINLRRSRSAGPAPRIPHVLPAQPERSAQMRRELREIHGLTENNNGNENDEI